jgi:hypothetical protein
MDDVMPTITYRTRDVVKLGEWVRSTYRPRTAYFIVGIQDKGPFRIGGVVGLAAPRVYKLEVERRKADAPQDGDIVHPIMWDSRGRKT